MCRPYLSLFYEHCSYAFDRFWWGSTHTLGRTQQQGIEQGIEQGAYQKILEIISNGIENKIPVEIIAVMTKLSIDEVQKIIKNNQLDQQE